MSTSLSEGKSFEISKQEVWQAYRRVKANKGAPGVDGVDLGRFERPVGIRQAAGVEPRRRATAVRALERTSGHPLSSEPCGVPGFGALALRHAHYRPDGALDDGGFVLV